MSKPPGLVYLYQQSPRLILPPAFVLLCYKLSRSCLNVPELHAWFLVLAMLFSLPLSLSLSVVYADYVNERDAAKQGARLPPQVHGKLPFGLSLLAAGVKNFKRGYPGTYPEVIVMLQSNPCKGDMMLRWSKDYGQTYNMRILFENRVQTLLPCIQSVLTEV